MTANQSTKSKKMENERLVKLEIDLTVWILSQENFTEKSVRDRIENALEDWISPMVAKAKVKIKDAHAITK